VNREATVALRVLRVSGGVALLAIGAALLVLPGPGVVTMMAGLVALSSEWSFARRIVARVEQRFPWLARAGR
jgi:hypothetical protein